MYVTSRSLASVAGIFYFFFPPFFATLDVSLKSIDPSNRHFNAHPCGNYKKHTESRIMKHVHGFLNNSVHVHTDHL